MAKQAAVRAIWAKKRRGEPLTATEEEQLREYHRRTYRAITQVYWDSPAQMQEFQEMAEKQGARNFSKWLLQQIERGGKASTLTKDEVQRLRDLAEEANRRFDQERETSTYFREKAKQFERERDDWQNKAIEMEARIEQMDKQMAQRKGIKQ